MAPATRPQQHGPDGPSNKAPATRSMIPTKGGPCARLVLVHRVSNEGPCPQRLLRAKLMTAADGSGRRGTTDNRVTSCLNLCLSSTALCDCGKSSPVLFLTLSSHRFLCLPLLLAPLAVPCKVVIANPDDRETCLYHFSVLPSLHCSQEIFMAPDGMLDPVVGPQR